MSRLKVHRKFKLNGQSFQKSDSLLEFVKERAIDGIEFLEVWFDQKDFIYAKTSGSTGVPKEIKIKKKHMLQSASATGTYFNLEEGTTALLCMSSDYIAGKMMWVRALCLGWELDVIRVTSNPLESTKKKYDFSAMVPLQVSNSFAKINLIKTLIVGGGAVSKELQDRLQFLPTKVFATYGMTETVTHIAVKKLNQFDANEKAYYKVFPMVTISKDDRGCMVIEAPLVSEGKVVTNDLVAIQSEMSFDWLGRYDSVINSGGIKLIPEQIEGKLSAVLKNNFFITGHKDSLLGEKVVLLIEGEGKPVKKRSEVLAYLVGVNLERYEYPKEIDFVKKFDWTETGKIKRNSTLEMMF